MDMIQREITANHTIDAVGLACGDLVLAVFNKMKKLKPKEVLCVIAYDLGALEDIPAWCRMQGHELIYIKETELIKTYFYIQKGERENV